MRIRGACGPVRHPRCRISFHCPGALVPLVRPLQPAKSSRNSEMGAVGLCRKGTCHQGELVRFCTIAGGITFPSSYVRTRPGDGAPASPSDADEMGPEPLAEGKGNSRV